MIVEIEMFKDGKWITDIRIYNKVKSLESFDLFTIPNKRRNVKIIS